MKMDRTEWLLRGRTAAPQSFGGRRGGFRNLFYSIMTPGHSPQSGLWLAATFFLILGGIVTAIIYLFGRPYDFAWREHVSLSVMVTVIVAGITAACASAHWWMHH